MSLPDYTLARFAEEANRHGPKGEDGAREDGMPITEYLPEGHEGREVYGVVPDPTPDKGRALKHKAPSDPENK